MTEEVPAPKTVEDTYNKYLIKYTEPLHTYQAFQPLPHEKNKFEELIKDQFHIGNSFCSRLMCLVIIAGVLYSLLYLLLGDEVLPEGDLFRLIFLVILAYVVGLLVSYVYLPPLLGMLITGVVLRSTGLFHLSGVYPKIVVLSRQLALCIILIKAGLGLDAPVLRRLKFMVIKLAILPCITEAVTAALLAHFILNFPWLWSFLLGFLLSPISPAVVVPTLLSLKENGYGEDKGIATLVIAASSVDDVFSISMFGVFVATIFTSGGSMAMKIVHGPMEMALGIFVGILWGCVVAVLPHKDDASVVIKRAVLIGAGGAIAVVGGSDIGFEGSGPLACITAAFVANCAWNCQESSEKGAQVSKVFSNVWIFMQPVLFGLIGTEIDLRVLDVQVVGLGLVIVFVSLVVRSCVCSLVTLGGKLNWKEVVFLNFAWLPKATVQAALAPEPLTLLAYRGVTDGFQVDMANFLLTTAVLAILITAPIGSIATNLGGPFLLKKDVYY